MHHFLVPHAPQKRKPWWEIEWSEEHEKETMERLSRLKMWNWMPEAKMKDLVEGIRENPAILDALEAEEKTKPMMLEAQQQAAAEGRTFNVEDIQRMGMRAHQHTFDEKDKKPEKK